MFLESDAVGLGTRGVRARLLRPQDPSFGAPVRASVPLRRSSHRVSSLDRTTIERRAGVRSRTAERSGAQIDGSPIAAARETRTGGAEVGRKGEGESGHLIISFFL